MSPGHPNRSGGRKAPIPREVRELRERLQQTQAEFAAWLDVGLSIVKKWEAGDRRMPWSTYEYACLRESSPEVRRARERWLESQRTKREAVIV